MGLLTGLLTLPLAPARGVVWVAEQVQRQAEHELASRDDPVPRLIEIEEAWQAGELSDDRRAELEEQVVQQMLATDREDG